VNSYLVRHPDSEGAAVTGIAVAAARAAGGKLGLAFSIEGNIEEIALPPARRPGRADGLWQHTCLEAFIGSVEPSYFEFNISPSTEWAAYRFAGRREGRSDVGVPPPTIRSGPIVGALMTMATLDLDGLAELPAEERWRLGLSAVIEEKSGAKSYWALAHSPGPPDFHDPDCFLLKLPPPVPA
jgi:hypothetical protein